MRREKLIKRHVVTRRWPGLLMRASALDVHQLADAAWNCFNYQHLFHRVHALDVSERANRKMENLNVLARHSIVLTF